MIRTRGARSATPLTDTQEPRGWWHGPSDDGTSHALTPCSHTIRPFAAKTLLPTSNNMASSVCDIQLNGASAAPAPASHSHDHSHTDAGHSHSHDAEGHGHSHPIMEHAGKFGERDMPDFSKRNWKERW